MRSNSAKGNSTRLVTNWNRKANRKVKVVEYRDWIIKSFSKGNWHIYSPNGHHVVSTGSMAKAKAQVDHLIAFDPNIIHVFN